jgi:hypothetical protein
MPIVHIGPTCARRGCARPDWRDGLCSRCRRLCRLFGREPGLFACEPLDNYRDERDAVALPWERWEERARAEGVALADLLGQPPPDPAPG